MTARLFALTPLAILSLVSTAAVAQPRMRTIRRDIPMTNMIRARRGRHARLHRGARAGTTGSWTDYKITARLDARHRQFPAGDPHLSQQQRLVDEGASVALDQNIFRPGTPNAGGVDLVTDGMKSEARRQRSDPDVTDTWLANSNTAPNGTLSRILKGTSAAFPWQRQSLHTRAYSRGGLELPGAASGRAARIPNGPLG